MVPTVPAKKKGESDPRKFLAAIGKGMKVVITLRNASKRKNGGY
jgi:hypothetical protein